MSGTAAELARTTVSRASSVRLVGPTAHRPGRPAVIDHAVRPDGSLELVVAGSAAALELHDAPVTAVVTDVSAAPSADRVRAEVRLGARLGVPDDAAAARVLESWVRHRLVEGVEAEDLLRQVGVIRMTPVAVRLAASCGCFAPVGGRGEPVDLDRYRAAPPDRLALVENEWLGHLMSSHGPEMAAFARVVTDPERPGHRVVPHAVDERGLVFRRDPATGPGCLDVRLDFDRRARCLCEATDAWDRLAHRWLAPDDSHQEP